MPKVSVIIPVYNTEKYLSECIDSVLNQTLKDIEVILVNDGSTDNSPAICDQYAATDARVRVIHKENGGVSSARNEGLNHVTGEYYAFVDSDDFIDPNMYYDLYAQAERNQVPLVICSGYYYYYYSNTCKTINDCTNNIDVLSQEDLFNHFIFGRKQGYAVLAISLCCKLYRTEKFRHIKFDESLTLAEDQNYMTFLSVLCDDFCFIDKPYYYYRKNTESLTYRPFSEMNCNILQVLANREACYLKSGLLLQASRAARNYIEEYIYIYLKHSNCVKYLQRYRKKYKLFKKKYRRSWDLKAKVRYFIFGLSPQLYDRWILRK